MKFNQIKKDILITAGSTYLDIDAYACAVALAELLQLCGENAVAYSKAPCNYSVCCPFDQGGQIVSNLPQCVTEESAQYIIVDVSDPRFLGDSVPLDRVIAVYDHHIGYEDFWKFRIGDNAHIEFIGAAATLIYREWKIAGLEYKMKRSTALLLIVAILDNTLNLMSSNTTKEDREAYSSLCLYAGVDDEFRAAYFLQVQENIIADLKNALFNDVKCVTPNSVLPYYVGQLCIWDTSLILSRLTDIRAWFNCLDATWMLNLIDVKHGCSYFICDDLQCQNNLECIFDVSFEAGIAILEHPYLRKEIIKKTINFDII